MNRLTVAVLMICCPAAAVNGQSALETASFLISGGQELEKKDGVLYQQETRKEKGISHVISRRFKSLENCSLAMDEEKQSSDVGVIILSKYEVVVDFNLMFRVGNMSAAGETRTFIGGKNCFIRTTNVTEGGGKVSETCATSWTSVLKVDSAHYDAAYSHFRKEHCKGSALWDPKP